jgi:hypothetical protein
MTQNYSDLDFLPLKVVSVGRDGKRRFDKRDRKRLICGASGFFGHRFGVKRVFQTGVVDVEESQCKRGCARGAGRRA